MLTPLAYRTCRPLSLLFRRFWWILSISAIAVSCHACQPWECHDFGSVSMVHFDFFPGESGSASRKGSRCRWGMRVAPRGFLTILEWETPDILSSQIGDDSLDLWYFGHFCGFVLITTLKIHTMASSFFFVFTLALISMRGCRWFLDICHPQTGFDKRCCLLL